MSALPPPLSSAVAAADRGTPLAVAVGDGQTLTGWLFQPWTPLPAPVSPPLVLHLHGGAFTEGLPSGGAVMARVLRAAGAVVLSLDYPLAPEQPFPRALEAAYRVLSWLQRQRRRLAGSRSRLFVAGEECGGNLAAGLAMMVRDRFGPPLAGQILLSPMLDVCQSSASQRAAGAGTATCRWSEGWRHYLPRSVDAMHPYAAPAHAMRLTGLPPTLLVTAEDDAARDEVCSYSRRLRAAGVPVQHRKLNGPTGWPASYQDAPQCECAWTAPVCSVLQDFLQDPTQTSAPPTVSRPAPPP